MSRLRLRLLLSSTSSSMAPSPRAPRRRLGCRDGARSLRHARPGGRTPPVRRIAAGGHPRCISRAERLSCRPCSCAAISRMSRGAGLRVAPPTHHNYGILIDCCCHARRPDLALAFFGRLLRSGLKQRVITLNNLLKVLCDNRSQRALNLLRMMAESGGGCSPDVVAYNMVIDGFFKEGEVGHAHCWYLVVSLFSKKGKYSEHVKLLPTKYRHFEGINQS